MAVKKGTKEPSVLDAMRAHEEEMKRNHPLIETRFYVDEVTPGYNTGGYYDQDIPEERKQVSPFFESDGQCYEWMDNYDPDKGNHFEIMKSEKRRTIQERWWGPYRVAKIDN